MGYKSVFCYLKQFRSHLVLFIHACALMLMSSMGKGCDLSRDACQLHVPMRALLRMINCPFSWQKRIMCMYTFFHVHTDMNHRSSISVAAYTANSQAAFSLNMEIILTQLTWSSPSRMLRRNNRSSLERSSPWWPIPPCDIGQGTIASDSLMGSLSCCLCFVSPGPWKPQPLLCLGNCFWAEPSVSLLLERIL